MLLGGPALAAGDGYYLDAVTWAQPRNGQAVLQMAAVSDAVRELIGMPGATLEVHYPGGDAGSLWAHELQGWLVALGVCSAQIALMPGSGRADAIHLSVTPPRAAESR